MILLDGHEGMSIFGLILYEAKADFASFLFPSVETDGNDVYYKTLQCSAQEINIHSN